MEESSVAAAAITNSSKYPNLTRRMLRGSMHISSSYDELSGKPMNVDDHPANNVEHPSGNNDQ